MAPFTTSTAAPSCPGSNSTYYQASNGGVFLIECGIDHAGGDLSSTSVQNYQGCIEACASTTGCVDVSLSGSACYMKKAVGNPVYSNPGIQGAKFMHMAPGFSSSSSSSSSSSTLTTSVVSKSASSPATSSAGAAQGFVSASSSAAASSAPFPGNRTVSSSSASTTSGAVNPTVTAATCPGNNNDTYVDPTSGYAFILECGIDRAGGDLSMTYVTPGSLSACIAACATTSGCVDVSLSGAACYMKSMQNSPQQNGGIQGARLVLNAASSASVVSTATSTAAAASSTATTVKGPPMAQIASS